MTVSPIGKDLAENVTFHRALLYFFDFITLAISLLSKLTIALAKKDLFCPAESKTKFGCLFLSGLIAHPLN